MTLVVTRLQIVECRDMGVKTIEWGYVCDGGWLACGILRAFVAVDTSVAGDSHF